MVQRAAVRNPKLLGGSAASLRRAVAQRKHPSDLRLVDPPGKTPLRPSARPHVSRPHHYVRDL
jgi:hypothetical protein